ncbi:hypothetical protein QQS21_005467 [Conoideocrella luteorostrata]|uniref:Uncharacterized protein n=1 Tax=Conoideocrella luteorostrata TaxID=1105319 RepID=A0AAJ0FYZ7_9HYPO|nr:hypothetical protein QQS21_005467 [Conoideocrella luteorostrata]
MTRAAYLALFALAGVSQTVFAANCKEGLQYCGTSLLQRGNYVNDISEALFGSDFESDNEAPSYEKLLFSCPGPNGEISLTAFCVHGCENKGQNRNDTCAIALPKVLDIGAGRFKERKPVLEYDDEEMRTRLVGAEHD